MKLISKAVYYIFIAAILTVALMLFSSALPIPGNVKFFTVLSGSMEPAIKTGSVVMVKPSDQYKIGEIVTFGPNTKTRPPTTHRVIDIEERGNVRSFITQGDANNAPDARAVRQYEIIGKTVLSVPYAGYAVAAAQKPYGFILIIVVPALLIIIDEAQKIWLEIRKARAGRSKKLEV